MFHLLKNLLASKDDKKTLKAEEDFDALVNEVQADAEDLEKLAEHIEDEFEGLDMEVQAIQKGVDEIVGDER
ncbi:hypothetical protein KJ657_04710 [Patescibacteria group bacterium]|nr:hypothetical protein [Patescibacteria group bacterium]MBU1016356.1 hypothetical protein [Patescibacteria group bacterium]MBU1684650.1 hypothetical protein [Patescibacteria group bacterium]MBU1938426.1 hypothetical protein [Patescibacteria group bacterium]